MNLRYKVAWALAAAAWLGVAALALTLSYSEPCGEAPSVQPGAETMNAYVFRCYGSPEVLSYEEVAKPVPGEGDVLVKVRSASVNPLDWHHMRGSPYFMRLGLGVGAPEDVRLGVDFSGVVEAVGAKVTRFEPGDEVFGGRSGAFAEYVVVPADRALARKPAGVSFDDAAAVPVAAITALQALRDLGQLQRGQNVLINGASGGVGTFAVQIAKSMGAEVTGVCSTRNVEKVQSIGADFVIDYKKEDYTESGRKFDLIIDMVGNHGLLANRRVMTDEGRLVIVGGPKGNWLGPVMGPVKAMFLSPLVDQHFEMILASMNQADLETLAGMLSASEIIPVIDRSYDLARLQDAIAYSETGRARGKIVIDMQ